MNFFVLYLLACIGAHRLWNYEAVFAPLVTKLRNKPWLKSLWCPPCNAFWIAVVLAILAVYAEYRPIHILLMSLAAYPLVRSGIWVYANAAVWVRPLSTPPTPPAPPAPSVGMTPPPISSTSSVSRSYERNAVILTALHNFDPSYSLVGVICDQARMLAADPMTQVHIWVIESCDLAAVPPGLPENVQITRIVPNVSWINDQVIDTDVTRIVDEIRPLLGTFADLSIITHDLLFQSSFLTFAKAIRVMGLPDARWFHQAHSAAALKRPEGLIGEMRASLPDGHKLLAVSASDAVFMANYYQTSVDHVLIVPNSRDIRSFLRMDPLAYDLIQKHRLMEADVVQIYPLSGTRMDSKGLPTLIRLFAEMKKYQNTVRLLVVNAHSNGLDVTGKIRYYREIAASAGLLPEELIFTSEDYPAIAYKGLPAETVSGLFQTSNLFVFPTVSEACPLVLMEAALSGCLLVLNSSVPMLFDIIPHTAAISFPFGGAREAGAEINLDRAAGLISETLDGSLANQSKRTVLRNHNFTVLGAQLRDLIFSSL